MGKTPAPSRAGRKSKSKRSERKWCICQERCNGGKEVAASTYRSHNPTTMRSTAEFEDGPVRGVGGKRKAMDGVDGSGFEGGIRETRRMRARRVAQNGETVSQLPVATTGDRTGTLDLDDSRPQKTKTHEHREDQAQEYVESDDEREDEEPSWILSVASYSIENDDDYAEDDQLRATLRSVNEMVSAILSWD